MTKNEKEMVIISPVQKADVPNKNGTIFPREVLERAVEEWNAGPKLGVVFDETRMMDDVKTRLSDVAVEVELSMDKEGAQGKAVVLDTPSGKILRKLMISGWMPEISIAYQATMHKKEDGTQVVGDDFKIIRTSIIDKEKKA